MVRLRVLLYGDWPLALTYLDPLARHIAVYQPSWEVAFAGDISREPDHMNNPDVVITCDELSVAPDAPLKICIFHGLASKAQAFSTLRRDAFVNTSQVFAVAGPYYEKLLLDMGVPQERVFISGVTKFDGIQRKILYAPTHNKRLSAIPIIQGRIYEIPDVKVHLHQWTRTGSNPHHAQFRSYYPIHEDREDIWDLLATYDVIIGDFGSTIVEAIGLGKQAIQVVNPEYRDYYIDQKGLTQEQVQQMPEVELPLKYATRVFSFEELHEALSVVANIGTASHAICDWIVTHERP